MQQELELARVRDIGKATAARAQDQIFQSFRRAVCQFVEQLLLVFEVVVQVSLADIHLVRDHLHRGAVIAALQKQMLGLEENPVPQLILQYLHVLHPFILKIRPKKERSLMLKPFLRSFYGLFCALKRLSNALRELIRAARTASVSGNTAEIALDLIDRHALDNAADGLKIAVAAARKADVVHGITLQIERNSHRANPMRLVIKMLHPVPVLLS